MSAPPEKPGPGHAETLVDPSLGEETLPPEPLDPSEPRDGVSSQAGGGLSAEEVGRYTARGELGQGGLGRVYVALDGHVGREVAVKELRSDVVGELEGDEERDQARLHVGQRFLREARVTGQLEHPGIMPVWNPATGRTLRVLRGHKDRPYAITWSPDGKRLASTPDSRQLLVGIGARIVFHDMEGVDRQPDPTALLKRA